MLTNKEVVATVAVKDLAGARKFYEGTLGLKVQSAEGTEAITFQAGPAHLLVYRSDFAGTNKATGLNFSVGADLAKIIAGLKERGVAFEHYDFPGVKREGDVHLMGPVKSAWFKDPDGNIIAILDR
jgi:catechol 2,3-dioxygenase-like lactoylglutathione lyase family enzyme